MGAPGCIIALALALAALFGASAPALAMGPRRLSLEEKRQAEFPRPVGVERQGSECLFLSFPASFRIEGAPPPLFGQHLVTAVSGSLEARYCERMFPPTLDAIYQGGFDVPAGVLHVSRQEIERAGLNPDYNPELKDPRPPVISKFSWSQGREYQPSAVDRSKMIAAADWNTIQELNLQAADAWELLLSCHGGDAEKARAAYARGTELCGSEPGRVGESSSVAERLQSLHGNAQAFLESSPMRDLKGATLLPKIHPLLTQILLEQFASDQIAIASEPNTANVVGFWAVVKHVGEVPDPLQAYSPYDFSKLSGHLRTQARRVLNTVLFLQMVPANRCEGWGLWPGLTRLTLGRYFYTDALDPMLPNVRKKVESACGEAAILPLTGYSQYSPWTDPALMDFHQMRVRYGQKGFQ